MFTYIIIIKPPMHVTRYLFMQPSELTKRGVTQISDRQQGVLHLHLYRVRQVASTTPRSPSTRS